MSDTLRQAALRASMVVYARRFIGEPYRWGGDDPVWGFDCSGFMVEVLASRGIIGRGEDYTAAGLQEMLTRRRCPVVTGMPYAGCLVFFPDEQGITRHVAMMVDNEHIIHAAGGGSAVRTRDDAARHNAYIREDRVDYRGPYVVMDPTRAGEGE